jgi:hypothetical protein
MLPNTKKMIGDLLWHLSATHKAEMLWNSSGSASLGLTNYSQFDILIKRQKLSKLPTRMPSGPTVGLSLGAEKKTTSPPLNARCSLCIHHIALPQKR